MIFLPKQTDIDTILHIIQRKVLKRHPFTGRNKGNIGRVST